MNALFCFYMPGFDYVNASDEEYARMFVLLEYIRTKEGMKEAALHGFKLA